jgi:hypothetical protein
LVSDAEWTEGNVQTPMRRFWPAIVIIVFIAGMSNIFGFFPFGYWLEINPDPVWLLWAPWLIGMGAAVFSWGVVTSWGRRYEYEHVLLLCVVGFGVGLGGLSQGAIKKIRMMVDFPRLSTRDVVIKEPVAWAEMRNSKSQTFYSVVLDAGYQRLWIDIDDYRAIQNAIAGRPSSDQSEPLQTSIFVPWNYRDGFCISLQGQIAGKFKRVAIPPNGDISRGGVVSCTTGQPLTG